MLHLYKLKQTFLPLIILASCGSAFALDCGKAITTPEINECASIDQKKVEAKLNKVYQRVLKSLDVPDAPLESYSEMRKSLMVAQRAWVKFREADCNAVYQKHVSGTIRTVMYIGCMHSHAEKRIRELEYYESQ
jgi:uncharacterized protein YecT (DUF1311 family)